MPTALEHAHYYDHFDRSHVLAGTRIFVGEWATNNPRGGPTGHMAFALGDAAWLTGLERNADVVMMNSYAPLFCNVNPGGMQWSVNLIGYDALGSLAERRPESSPGQAQRSSHGAETSDVVREDVPVVSPDYDLRAGRMIEKAAFHQNA